MLMAGVCADAVWAEEGLATRERDPRLQGRALTLCSHDHLFPRRKLDRNSLGSSHHSHDCVHAFLQGHNGDHDLGQVFTLITPYYCNTAANPPRQYNTRDRQLVLNRLPMRIPLSGALYVTFNSVQIDFVYFTWNTIFSRGMLLRCSLEIGGVPKSMQRSKEGKRLYRQSCSSSSSSSEEVAAVVGSSGSCCHTTTTDPVATHCFLSKP